MNKDSEHSTISHLHTAFFKRKQVFKSFYEIVRLIVEDLARRY